LQQQKEGFKANLPWGVGPTQIAEMETSTAVDPTAARNIRRLGAIVIPSQAPIHIPRNCPMADFDRSAHSVSDADPNAAKGLDGQRPKLDDGPRA
jgi:hypothetical protein